MKKLQMLLYLCVTKQIKLTLQVTTLGASMKVPKKTHICKTIHTEFSSEQLTIFSGINPIFQNMKKHNILKGLSGVFTNELSYNSSKFSDYQIALTTILGNLSGVKHMNNLSNFSNDQLIKNLIGLDKPINENAISCSFKRLGEHGARELESFTLKTVKEFMKQNPTKSGLQTLDADSTVKSVCGNQEGSAKGFNPDKRGAKSYNPQLLFCSEYKTLLHSWFRTGSAYTSNGICDILRQVQGSLEEVLPNVFFRADSGYFSGDLFDLMDEFGWTYLVKVKLSQTIKDALVNQKWIKSETNTEVCEFDYKCKDWSTSRKFKAVRIQTGVIEQPLMDQVEYSPIYVYFCYCTNLDNTPLEIHRLYAKRAESENWIEHVKNQLFAGQTLTDDFWANDLLWQLSTFAYNISVMFRFKDSYAHRQEPKTFRDWFINVAGKVVEHAGCIVVKMYKYYHYQDKWLKLAS